MAQETSSLWKALLRTKGTKKEYQFDINGTVYGPEREVEHSVDAGLYEEFGIGNAAALIIRGVQGDEGRILPVSVPVDGSDGGVFASLPCRLGKNGVEQVFRPDLAPEEEERFRASCARMEEFWRTIPGV